MTANTELGAVLIADDSATARMIIKQCIEISGFRDRAFVEARNGAEAWQILQQTKVDMVITDLNMPEVDGRMLLRLIKSTPALSDIPVIVATSASNPAREAELTRLGAASVINKPVSPAAIYEALAVLDAKEGAGE